MNQFLILFSAFKITIFRTKKILFKRFFHSWALFLFFLVSLRFIFFNMDRKISRRHFIGLTASTAGMFTIVPSFAVSGLGHTALCYIDHQYVKRCFDMFPDAQKHVDYRKMFDKNGKSVNNHYKSFESWMMTKFA